MKGKYIIAHDTGTGGNKAVLLDRYGNIVTTLYKSYPILYKPNGWVEQDPEKIWNTVATTTKKLIDESRIDNRDIIGIGISAQMFNLLPVDENGKPLYNMISWLDTRSVVFADKILKGNMQETIYNYTGNIPTAKDIIPRILWLKNRKPEIWKNTYKLLDCKEYLIHKLTGKFAIDWHGASVFFLFDLRKKRWSGELCSLLGIPISMLPDTYPSTKVIGHVTENASKITGLSPGTPVILSAGDVAAAQVGAGANSEGKAHICLGTATWLGISTKDFRNNPDKPFWLLNHSNPKKLIIAGEMETGGGSLMWLKNIFSNSQLSSYDKLGAEAANINVGSDGLIFCPWLSGERAPVLDHYARGVFAGLSLNHNRAHFTRSVMEGVSYHLKWITEEMKKIGIEIPSARAIGGGMKSKLWPEILADVTGLELEITENPLESGAIGTAATVLVALGLIANFEEIDSMIKVKRIVKPDRNNFKRYEKYYSIYLDIYRKLSPIFRTGKIWR